MATQPRLVNKQFNSPIGLYSEQNIKEVLQREQQILANGAVGIDFQNTAAGKPANLQNSAVLRMLEEEEHRQRSGRAGNEYIPRPLQDLTWPPPEHDQKNQLKSRFKDVVIPGVKRVAWPPPQEGDLDSPAVEHQAVTAQGGTQYISQTPGLQQNSYSQTTSQYQQQKQQQVSYQSSYRPLNPLDVSSRGSSSPLSSPALNQSPSGFRPATPSKQWAPVHSPVSTPQYQSSPQQYQSPGQQYQSQPQYQPVSQQYQPPSQHYQSAPQQNYQAPSQQFQSPGYQSQAPGQQYQVPSSQPQQYQAPKPFNQSSQPVATQAQGAPRVQSSKSVEPPPSTIILRPQAPVSQAPPPVFSSQPATATLRGGKHLRGDLKWPPEEVKEKMQEEKRKLIELAQGPAFRPTRVNKDYTPFFERHALNSNYPGYKIPPGTQFYRPL